MILNNLLLKTTSKKVIQETAEETGNLVVNKNANRFTKFQEVHRTKIQKKNYKRT